MKEGRDINVVESSHSAVSPSDPVEIQEPPQVIALTQRPKHRQRPKGRDRVSASSHAHVAFARSARVLGRKERGASWGGSPACSPSSWGLPGRVKRPKPTDAGAAPPGTDRAAHRPAPRKKTNVLRNGLGGAPPRAPHAWGDQGVAADQEEAPGGHDGAERGGEGGGVGQERNPAPGLPPTLQRGGGGRRR